MAAPDKLFTPDGAIYEVLAVSPDFPNQATGTYVTFKYKLSDNDTVPAWFKVPPAGNTWTFTNNDKTHIRIEEDIQEAEWSKWDDTPGHPDLFNRTVMLSWMSNAMFDEKEIDSNYAIEAHYTYNTYRIDASTNAVTITLPDPTQAVQRHVNLKVDDATNTITLTTPTGTIDGNSLLTLPYADCKQTFYTNGTNWYSSTPISFNTTDSAPVTNIRSMTQSEYNTLTGSGLEDNNTLYVIR